jgi:hypothetical protein
MKLKKTILAVLSGSAALAAAPVFADNGWHRGWQHERHEWRHGHAGPRVVVRAPVYYAPPPRVVYYSPAPVYYAPAPVYQTPAPIVSGAVVYPAPVYSAPVQPSMSLRFRLPL